MYSFHLTLSYSRDPFCRFTTSQDLATFWGAHVAAFRHFGGVPASIVYDRTKTVVRRHVAPGEAVPLHPEAVAFAEHYGFVVDVAAAHRPTCKGRVERQVLIVREHVLAGRRFTALAGLDDAFAAWLPIRRGQTHRTHGEVIGVRAERDRAALGPLPSQDYQVVDRHLRKVGKDCLVSFQASLYSVPARLITAGMLVELRIGPHTVAIHATGPDPRLLAMHRRARVRGDHQINPVHWAGLPDGSTRSTTTDPAGPAWRAHPDNCGPADLAVLLSRRGQLATPVARRELAAYQAIADAPDGRVLAFPAERRHP